MANSLCRLRPISSSASLAACTRGMIGRHRAHAARPCGVGRRSVRPSAAAATDAIPAADWAWPRTGRDRLGPCPARRAILGWPFRPRRSRGVDARISSPLRRKALSLEAMSCIERNSARSLPTRFSVAASAAVASSRSALARWTVLVNSSIMLWALASRSCWNWVCSCLKMASFRATDRARSSARTVR